MMRFKKKKKRRTLIDRRLMEINKEMAGLNSEVKAVSHSSVLRDFNAASRLQRGALAKVSHPSISAESLPASGVALAKEEAYSEVRADEAHKLSEGQEAPDSRHQLKREKFANYFMTGHFQNLRPLRQEGRILRNKAIMMIILVILAAIWVFYFLGSR